jgi:endonuclease/exonuclease/phosphatase family metal-dependent hydrolase
VADEATTARVLQINFRLYSASLTDGHPWSKRRVPFLKMLDDVAPSIIGAQECDLKKVVPDVLKHLGASWRYYNREGKVGVFYDSAKWELTFSRQYELDNGPESARRFVLVRLKSRSTGGELWVGVTHLGVHFDGEAKVRIAQANKIREICKAEGVVDGLVMGDLNDSKMPPADGVRKALEGPAGVTECVFYGLWHCLKPEEFKNYDFDTHHGYKAIRKTGKRLDDILTTERVVVLDAEIVRTDPGSDYPNATDHCGVFARIRFGEVVPPKAPTKALKKETKK